jgi:hypothetical protein
MCAATHDTSSIGDAEIDIETIMFNKPPQKIAAYLRIAFNDLRRIGEKS